MDSYLVDSFFVDSYLVDSYLMDSCTLNSSLFSLVSPKILTTSLYMASAVLINHSFIPNFHVSLQIREKGDPFKGFLHVNKSEKQRLVLGQVFLLQSLHLKDSISGASLW